MALGIIGAVLGLLLSRHAKELGVLLSLAACIGVILSAFSFLEPVVDFASRLRSMSGIRAEHGAILLKAAGMCMLTEITVSVCEEAGQGTLGKTLRICGSIALVYLSLPLLEQVLDLLDALLGG